MNALVKNEDEFFKSRRTSRIVIINIRTIQNERFISAFVHIYVPLQKFLFTDR